DAPEPLPHQAPLRGRVRQAVQYHDEDRLGHIEGQLAVLEQGHEGTIQLRLAPQALEHQRRAPRLRPAHHQALGLLFQPPPGALRKARQALDHRVELAALKLLNPPQVGDDALAGATAFAHALDQLQVGAGGAVFIPEGLRADKHGTSIVPPYSPPRKTTNCNTWHYRIGPNATPTTPESPFHAAFRDRASPRSGHNCQTRAWESLPICLVGIRMSWDR